MYVLHLWCERSYDNWYPKAKYSNWSKEVARDISNGGVGMKLQCRNGVAMAKTLLYHLVSTTKS